MPGLIGWRCCGMVWYLKGVSFNKSGWLSACQEFGNVSGWRCLAGHNQIFPVARRPFLK